MASGELPGAVEREALRVLQERYPALLEQQGRPRGRTRPIGLASVLTTSAGAGGVLMLLFIVVGVFAPWIAPFGFNDIAPIERLRPPSWEHWFGTDNLGRDVLSRCIHGARLSVIIGCAAASFFRSTGFARA